MVVALKPKIKEKRWSAKIEKKVLESWKRDDIYRFDESSGKPFFSIDTPPPYASGRWHVGGAAHYAQIDMVARYFRMKGYEVLFPFGVDRNGLPVEVEVEKAHRVSLHETPREEFLGLCKSFLDKVEGNIISIAERLGMSCDLKRYYKTDSPEYRRITQATFIELWKKGLVYEDERPTNWCPVCKTTIADAEVDYEEKLTDLYYIRFRLEDGDSITVATTRPELLCTCAAIIYNPKDERYSYLKGKKAVIPIFKKKVPTFSHPYAKPEFGTGLVMICSYGDYGDVRLFRELSLDPIMAIDEDGKMLKVAGPYKGLSVMEARALIVRDLSTIGALEKVEKIRHRIPICWRSKNPIEFISMKEFYLKQLAFLDELSSMITTDMEFYPESSRKLLLDWMRSLTSDWPISRRRYYGTEIPIWYCKRCGEAHVPKPGRYYQPWRDAPPFDKCAKCGSGEFVGEDRIFDTWIDSSISQLFILGYGSKGDLFSKLYPCTLRAQGKDIVRSWLYYSILRTYQLLQGKAFDKVRISGMGLDERGEAMHKSKGNVVYPEPILDKYGADAFRLWCAMESRLGSDYRFSEKRVSDAHRFLTKLWNVARFISAFPFERGKRRLVATDRMILSNLNDVIRECEVGYEKMDFFLPSLTIRRFTWSVFADHYIECVKARAYNTPKKFDDGAQRGAWYTLHACLQTVLKLLAPICPFMTDYLWREVYGKSVHIESFPTVRRDWEDKECERLLDPFVQFNTAIWKFKKERGLPLTAPLKVVYAPPLLSPLRDDLQAMHQVEEILFKKPPGEVVKVGEGIYVKN